MKKTTQFKTGQEITITAKMLPLIKHRGIIFIQDDVVYVIHNTIGKNVNIENYEDFMINREILKAIEASKDEQIILADDGLEQKLFDLLNIMKDEDIRYEKDGESHTGEAETTNDVLGIIINNYHSQIINK